MRSAAHRPDIAFRPRTVGQMRRIEAIGWIMLVPDGAVGLRLGSEADRSPVRRTKQMGPALLLAPLSPTRGLCRSCAADDTSSAALSRPRLASDVWPVGIRLATAASVGFRHRRSHRHPAFASPLQRLGWAEAHSARCQDIRLAETACHLTERACGGFRPKPASATRPVRLTACPMMQFRVPSGLCNLRLVETSRRCLSGCRATLHRRHP
jgi:hypothetical protein